MSETIRSVGERTEQGEGFDDVRIVTAEVVQFDSVGVKGRVADIIEEQLISGEYGQETQAFVAALSMSETGKEILEMLKIGRKNSFVFNESGSLEDCDDDDLAFYIAATLIEKMPETLNGEVMAVYAQELIKLYQNLNRNRASFRDRIIETYMV